MEKKHDVGHRTCPDRGSSGAGRKRAETALPTAAATDSPELWRHGKSVQCCKQYNARGYKQLKSRMALAVHLTNSLELWRHENPYTASGKLT